MLRCHIAVLLFIAISGCASLVREPLMEVRSTSVINVDTAGFDIELVVGVENPNPFDIALVGFTYDIQVMSVPFSSGGLQRGFRFPAGRRTDIRLPFRIHHADLLGIIKRRPDLDRVPYSLDARLNMDSPFGELVIPVRKADTFSVPKAYRPGTYLKRILQPFTEMP